MVQVEHMTEGLSRARSERSDPFTNRTDYYLSFRSLYQGRIERFMIVDHRKDYPCDLACQGDYRPSGAFKHDELVSALSTDIPILPKSASSRTAFTT